MQQIIAYARGEGLHWLKGQVLSENSTMLKMCRELGFTMSKEKVDPSIWNVSLRL